MRILAWLCSAFAAAAVVSEYLLPSGALLPLSIGCIFLSILGSVFFRKRKILILLVTIGCGLGFARCWLHERYVIEPTEILHDQQRVVIARVVDYPEVYDTAEYVVVRLTGDLPGNKCRLSSYEGGLADLRPGDEIEVEVRLRSARWRYGEETDRYSSKGIFLLGYCQSRPNVTGRWQLSSLYAPKKFCHTLKECVLKFFPTDAAPFMLALLTGDKTELYADEISYVQLTKAGLSHVVAVSGMHVSILIGFLLLFTNNRLRLALISVPMLLFFTAMMGFTPSVCRAVFMQLYLLTAGVVDRENDTPTALAVVLALLLLENPSAAASVGLQLSFAATAGIMLLSGRIYRWMYAGLKAYLHPGRAGKKLLAGFSANMSTTLGALIFTTPLTALHFGTVSVIALLSNPLCLWVISILFVGGYFAVIMSAIMPALAGLTVWVLAWGVRYIFLICNVLCRFRYPVVYMQHPSFVIWLCGIYLLFLFALYLCRRDGIVFRPVVPVCLAFLALVAQHFMLDVLSRRDHLEITALDVGQGQCIVLENRTHTAVVDCGSSSSEENVGQIATNYLYSQGREVLDVAVVTHAHNDHINGMSRLLASIRVDALVLPEETDRNNAAVKELLTIAQRRGTDVYWLSENGYFVLGDMKLTLYAFNGKESDYEKGLGVMAAQDEFEALILGDMQSYAEWILSAYADFPDTEVLVVSHHGSKTSTSEHLLEAARPDMAIISVGYNSYGHPHEETLQRLASHNIDILRTDRDGLVRVRANKE